MFKSFKEFNLLEKLYTGRQVAKFVKDITPSEIDIPHFFIDKHILPNRFELKPVDLRDLLKTDKDFKEYYDNYSPRYEDNEVDSNDLSLPIVVHNGEILDGYSRSAENLIKDDYITKAYVSI